MKRMVGITLLALSALPFVQGQTGTSTRPAPQGFKLSEVGYVMLGVANVPASVEFYHAKLGLDVAMQSDDLALIKAGKVSLAISSEVGRKTGDDEVVFVVEHVEGAYDALSQGGVAFERKPHALDESSWAASFRDPDGHILSLYGPR